LLLIALILGRGYRTTLRAFRRDSALGALLVAYVVTAVTYNVSEACFRMLGTEWFVLLLSIVTASRVIRMAKGQVASASAAKRLLTPAVA
jgi:hypothetical protein